MERVGKTHGFTSVVVSVLVMQTALNTETDMFIGKIVIPEETEK